MKLCFIYNRLPLSGFSSGKPLADRIIPLFDKGGPVISNKGIRKMNFTKSELEMLYQYAAPTKEETLAGLKEIVPVLERKDDLLSKVIAWNTIQKLEKLAEPECSRFIADNRPLLTVCCTTDTLTPSSAAISISFLPSM